VPLGFDFHEDVAVLVLAYEICERIDLVYEVGDVEGELLMTPLARVKEVQQRQPGL
jgi:hypothetical protein